jgi:uncharacterized membrane protein
MTAITFTAGFGIGVVLLSIFYVPLIILLGKRCNQYIEDCNREVRRYYSMYNEEEKIIKDLREKLNEYETIEELSGITPQK